MTSTVEYNLILLPTRFRGQITKVLGGRSLTAKPLGAFTGAFKNR